MKKLIIFFYIYLIICPLCFGMTEMLNPQQQNSTSNYNQNPQIFNNLTQNSYNQTDFQSNQFSAPLLGTTQSIEEQHWQRNNIATNDHYTQFNWQQRKLLKQKTYKIYINVLSVINDIEQVTEKYKSKENDIFRVISRLDEDTEQIIHSINSQYKTIEDVYHFYNDTRNKIEELKKKEYFSINKNFRDLIETVDIEISNIYKMIENIIQNKKNLEQLKNVLLESFYMLDTAKNKAKNYENELWKTYQYLDELISDKKANEYYSYIINYSDNIIQINNFIRGEFLSFFNSNLSFLNKGNSSIKSAVQDLSSYIKNTGNKIDSIDKELAQYEKDKQELEEKKRKVEEEMLKIAEENKIKEIARKKRMEELKPWYLKIVSHASTYFSDITQKSYQIVKNALSIISSYIKSIISNSSKKILKLASKNTKLEQVVTPVVDPILEKISPQENIPLQEFTFSQNDTTTQTTDLIDNTTHNTSLIPGDQNMQDATPLDDVFNNQLNSKPFIEKNISGGSSYPSSTIANSTFTNQVPTAEMQPPADLISTEEIPVAEDNNSEESEVVGTSSDQFHYTPIENSGETHENDQIESLLPDLSDTTNYQARESKTSFDQKENNIFNVEKSGKKTKPKRETNKKPRKKPDTKQ